MFEVLGAPELYRYLDYGPPPSVDDLRSVYEELEARVSPDGSQLWLNWVIRPTGGAPVGFVQATVGGADAWVAYVLAREFWGRGYAFQATQAVVAHLRATCGVIRFLAVVEAGNAAVHPPAQAARLPCRDRGRGPGTSSRTRSGCSSSECR